MSGKDMPNMDSPLVAMRLAKGLTQKDLADALGKTEQAIRNWEHGKSEPKLTLAETKTFCRLLGKTLEEMPDDFLKPIPKKGGGKTGKRLKQLNLI